MLIVMFLAGVVLAVLIDRMAGEIKNASYHDCTKAKYRE
jgi:hypothetical protein